MMLKPMTPSVGKTATKKNIQPTKAARVHRQEINKPTESRNVPTAPARSTGTDRSIGGGYG